MSNEIAPVEDPGLPAHVHRKADHDPVAEKKAERQVAVLFLLSVVGTVLMIYSYILFLAINSSSFQFLVLPMHHNYF